MMVPEFRADQGGGFTGITRVGSYGASVAISPSVSISQEEILSRYRPIAPKPLNVKVGDSAASTPSDPPSSSTLSFERSSCGKTVSSDGSRGKKRSRNRIGAEPPLPSTRRTKRGPTAKPRSIPGSRVPAVIGGIQKAVEQFAPEKSGLQGMPPIPAGGAFRPLKCMEQFAPEKSGLHPMLPIPTGTIFRPMKPYEQFAPVKSEFQAMPPLPTGGVFRPMKGASSPDVAEMALKESGSMCKVPEGPGTGSVRFDRKRYGFGFGALKVADNSLGPGSDWSSKAGGLPDVGAPMTSVGDVGEVAAFINRASVASSQQSQQHPFSQNESIGLQKLRGGYDGGFDNSPKCGSDVPYRAPSIKPHDVIRTHPPLTNHLSFTSSNDESEVISGGDGRKMNLVTLSLLPDTPSHPEISSEVYRPTSSKHLPILSLAVGCDSRIWEAENNPDSPQRQDAKMDEKRKEELREADRDRSGGRGSSAEKHSRTLEGRVFQEPVDKVSRVPVSCRDSEDRAAVFDVAYMERQHSTSSDPMILADAENGDPLWANQAYKKADDDRNSGKTKEAGAIYLDPLGVPTRLAAFAYQPPEGPIVNAVLWGFLKKFMMPGTNRVNLSPEGREDGEERNEQLAERMFPSTLKDYFPDNSLSGHPKPITPQPVRPVGSTLTLERVESVNHFASPITDNLDFVKEQLELAPMPSVITDCKNRVRWVNAAYKQMVGQPECPWLASTVGKKTTKETSQHNRLTGEVMLNCDEQLSQMSAVFLCRVHVQWTNDGGEYSITVPSEVTRIDTDKLEAMFMWRLDIRPTN